jgi:hypothetical protein
MATETKPQSRRTPAKPRIKRRITPAWERGYYSHGYWRGNVKLGTVKLAPRAEWDGIYRWEAGSLAGETTSLEEAKRAVEAAALAGASQMKLFGD